MWPLLCSRTVLLLLFNLLLPDFLPFSALEHKVGGILCHVHSVLASNCCASWGW